MGVVVDLSSTTVFLLSTENLNEWKGSSEFPSCIFFAWIVEAMSSHPGQSHPKNRGLQF